jgi:RNA polymerase sigma-70 factor (ECF subfamily)
MDDNAIVALYHSRDESAIRETEKKYGHYLTKIAYAILADFEDSKESVNDTYLKAWNSIPPHSPEVLSTFLGKIIRRLSIDLLRKRSSQKRKGSRYVLSLSELEDCLSADTGNPVTETESALLTDTLNRWLRTQSEQVSDIFVGRYYFLDSVKDIAANFGMSESNVKVTLFRARKELKQFLGREGFTI